MDYRKLLGARQTEVLPYLGGHSVESASRRLRLAQRPEAPGWYVFEVKGRVATATGPAEAPSLEALPRVRGHLWNRRLVREGAVAEWLHLLGDEDPALFTPARARRWHSGQLILESLDFEGEAEGNARAAFEVGRAITDVAGAPASLRAAFGYAVLERLSERMDVPFTPAEVRRDVGEVALGDVGAGEALLRTLQGRRAAYAALREGERRASTHALPRPASRRGAEDVVARVSDALDGSGARLVRTRALGGDRQEVVFDFSEERFVAVVNPDTLQLLDAGICLSGADAELTLDSLPAVIREAIDQGLLVVTRHDR
jgi:hypothetical protein